MFVFEKVRSKRFPWAWSFLRGLQAPLLVVGTPLNCLVDWSLGPGSSLYLSLGLILCGSCIMFLIDSGGISFESLGYPASCTPVLKSAHRIIHSTTLLKIHDFSGF